MPASTHDSLVVYRKHTSLTSHIGPGTIGGWVGDEVGGGAIGDEVGDSVGERDAQSIIGPPGVCVALL